MAHSSGIDLDLDLDLDLELISWQEAVPDELQGAVFKRLLASGEDMISISGHSNR